MQGSSAFQFGRAAYRAGLLGRRQLLADALRQRPVPPARRHRRGLAGAARADRGVAGGHAASSTSSGSAPTCWPGSCRASIRRCWRSPTSTRTPGGRAYIVTAASQELADILAQVLALRRRDRLGDLRGRRRRLHRPADRPVRVPHRQGGGDRASWPRARASTSRPPTPTRTPSPTCRCCEAVGHPVAVNPDGTLARIAREEGWEVLRFDRLGRRLKTAAALGGGGGRGRGRRACVVAATAATGPRSRGGWPAAHRPARATLGLGAVTVDCRAMLITSPPPPHCSLTALVIAVSAVSALASSGKTVKVGDNYFGPKTLTVGKGTKVTWKWVGVLRHNVVRPDGALGVPAPGPRCAAASATPSPRRAPTSWSARSIRR